jgi:hypothetical protein
VEGEVELQFVIVEYPPVAVRAGRASRRNSAELDVLLPYAVLIIQ